MSVEVDPLMPDAIRMYSVQKDTLTSVLNIATKVDENALRKRSSNALVAILDKITAAEKTLH